MANKTTNIPIDRDPSGDPIELGAALAPVLQELHGENDVTVRLYSDNSGYAEDRADDDLRESRGRYRTSKRQIDLNLDDLAPKGGVYDLSSPKAVRKHPVLAGVAAHESSHVKFSKWGTEQGLPIPAQIPGPDGNPVSVSETGKMLQWAMLLEESRVERLAMEEFPAQWGQALIKSGFHDVRELLNTLKEEAQERREDPETEAGSGKSKKPGVLSDPQAVARVVALLHGKAVAGSVDAADKQVISILDLCRDIMDQQFGEGAYEAFTQTVGEHVFSDEHKNPWPHLEAARRVLAVMEPENQDDPDGAGSPKGESGESGEDSDSGGKSSPSEGEGEGGKSKGKPESSPEGDDDSDDEGAPGASNPGEGEDEDEDSEDSEDDSEEPGDGGGDDSDDSDDEKDDESESGAGDPPPTPDTSDLEEKLEKALQDWGDEEYTVTHSEEEAPEDATPDKNRRPSHGSRVYRNPQAPKVDREVTPEKEDRDLYHSVQRWLERQAMPTVSEREAGQWLPSGGARLDVRGWVRDNMADHIGSQRSDWAKLVETVKPAPPVRVGIMLDASGSMSSYTRHAASVAWAVANAAADLPDARTVSVAFGNAAGVTQEVGHTPARTVNVMRADGATEDWTGASELVTEALWLDDDETADENERSNALIVIVSDLMFVGDSLGHKGVVSQAQRFIDDAAMWLDRGYRIVVVGALRDYNLDRVKSYYRNERPGVDRDKADRVLAGIDFVTRPTAEGFDAVFA